MAGSTDLLRQVRQPNGQPGEVQPSITRSSIKGVCRSGSPRRRYLSKFHAPKIKVSSTHISDMKASPVSSAEFKDCLSRTIWVFTAAVHIDGQRMALKVTFDNCIIRNNKGTGVLAQPMEAVALSSAIARSPVILTVRGAYG